MAADDDLTTNHPVVSHDEWLAARRALLEHEKAFTRQCDEMSRLQRSLPWERVTKEYVFDGPDGRESLGDLFANRSQLIVYHFMFHPDDKAVCPHCSLRADGFAGIGVHLNHRDVTMVVVSRAPLPKLADYQQRMGWRFKWVSSFGSDFNYDYHASYTRDELDSGEVFHNYKMQKLNSEDQPGTSVFYKDDSDVVFHTYSSYERGLDIYLTAYHYLDVTPKGRNEESAMDWVNRHDEY